MGKSITLGERQDEIVEAYLYDSGSVAVRIVDREVWPNIVIRQEVNLTPDEAKALFNSLSGLFSL